MKNFGKLFFSLLLVLQLFSCSKYNGFDEPIVFSGHTLSIRDVFGDDQKAYLIVELKWPENADFSDYRLQDVSIKTKATGGYSWDLIGCDKENNSQLYLISLTKNNFYNKRFTIRFSNISSETKKMFVLIYGDWIFSGRLKFDREEKRTVYIGENGVEKIEMYNKAIIIEPSTENGNLAKIKDFDFDFTGKSGEAVEPICASNETQSNYHSQVYFIFESASSIEQIIINSTSYSVKGENE